MGGDALAQCEMAIQAILAGKFFLLDIPNYPSASKFCLLAK